MDYLIVEQLNKKYHASTVIDHIDLTVEKSHLITLLGPSGCGKSTLLRCIAGLSSVDGGRITLNNRDITKLSPQNRKISMVFQSYALFPNMNVEQNVAFGLKMQKPAKYNASEIKQKVIKMLELVELAEYSKRYPHQLSGGQCQRVSLARALVVEPDLLLLDEPLSALDAKIRKTLRQQIRKINSEMNMTAIFVTHDQEEAMEISDKIALMGKGKIIQYCTPIQLYQSPANTYVANFMGNNNVLTAQQINQLIHADYQKSVAIRPELMELSQSESSDRIPVNIVRQQVLGNIIRYHVECHDLHLRVDKLNIETNNFDGQSAYLRVLPESIVPLND